MTTKSIWAIAAGLIFVVAVTTLVDILLHAVGVFPPVSQPIDDTLALLATSYRIVIGIGGGWLTARLAPAKPMTHALVLGVIGTVLGVAGIVATWSLGLGPRWYPVAIAVLAIPQCWAGGAIHGLQSHSPADTVNVK
jgi:hypothetical protein